MTVWMLVRGAMGLLAAALLTVLTTLVLMSGSRPLAWSLPAGDPPAVRPVAPSPPKPRQNPESTPVVQPDPPASVPAPPQPVTLPETRPAATSPAPPPPTQLADQTPPQAAPKPPATTPPAERPKTTRKTSNKATEVARLTEQLSKGNRKDRLDAAKQLGAIGPDADAAVPILCLAMASGDPALQLSASESLELIDPVMRQKMLILLINPVSERSRERSTDAEIRSLLTLGESAKLYIPLLLSPAVQARCNDFVIVDVVAQMDRETPANVLRVINWATQSSDYRVRSMAVTHLPAMRGLDDKRAAAALLYLRDAITGNGYRDLELAIRVVEELGPLCKAAVPILRQLKLHPNGEIRLAAERALEAVDGQASPLPGKR